MKIAIDIDYECEKILKDTIGSDTEDLIIRSIKFHNFVVKELEKNDFGPLLLKVDRFDPLNCVFLLQPHVDFTCC